MTDMQVSNARRIVFTALAVVAFWLVVLVAHRLEHAALRSDAGVVPGAFSSVLLSNPQFWDWDLLTGVLGLTLLPTVFVLLSANNSLRGLRDPHLSVCAGLMGCTIAFGWWIGEHNIVPVSTWSEWSDLFWDEGFDPVESFDSRFDKIRAEHHVSPFWLLFPIILTTAFVVFGAWRRTVRDAAVDAVGEEPITPLRPL